MGDSRVAPLLSRGWEPEDLLRDALSRVSKMRAEGRSPGVIVCIVEAGILPIVTYGNADELHLAAASVQMQRIAHREIETAMERDS